MRDETVIACQSGAYLSVWRSHSFSIMLIRTQAKVTITKPHLN